MILSAEAVCSGVAVVEFKDFVSLVLLVQLRDPHSLRPQEMPQINSEQLTTNVIMI